MMKTDDRHRQRFPRTISSGDDGREISRSPPRFISLCTGFPPFDLSRVSLDAKPPASKELDVSAAESQIVCNRSLREVNSQPSCPSPYFVR
jgi:hypothetical protein